jgi:lipopolysaccharide export system permease protein
MRILDRYLVRRFFQAYLITFASLIGLYLVIDAFTNLDEFSEHSQSVWSVLQHMAGYYSYRVILFFDRLAGIIGMMSAMFTLTWMQRQGELTPLLAAGVPLYRVAGPVVGAAVLISGVQVANQELVIPQIRNRLLREADDLTGNKVQPVEGAYDNETNIFLGGKRGYAQQKRIGDAQFILPPTVVDSLTMLRAENAYYIEPQGKQPGGWKLVGTEPVHLRVRPEYRDKLFPLPGSKKGQYFLVSHVSYDQAVRRREWHQYASTAELIALLRNPSIGAGPEQAVLVHSRHVRPLLNLVLLLVTLPLTIARGGRNFFLSMGISLAVSGAFFGTVSVSHYLGNLGYSWFPPALAAWLPLLIFGSLATAVMDQAMT